MKVLVLGATGLLGREVMQVLKDRGIRALGAARSGADLQIDITNQMALFRLLVRVDCDAVINAAACVDVGACELDPEAAYRINGAPAAVLAAWSQQTDGRYIQVSTDNYFMGDLPEKHDESALVSLTNAYAASKFSGECLAREAKNSLIVRTNICGAQKGFGRWVIDSLKTRAPMGVFTDYFTSTMHAHHCAETLADLLVSDATGLINVGSCEVSSKARFIRAVAQELETKADWLEERSVASLKPVRARSCGLDVSRVEDLLGRPMPTLKETVRILVAEDNRCATPTTSNLATAV
ncbi:MAG: NAD(P)-dependent oxidoreductase [Ponticaulis sp.]|nr:NAD(P)-dependent oxidoreductase [Ponticaulis sp.]